MSEDGPPTSETASVHIGDTELPSHPIKPDKIIAGLLMIRGESSEAGRQDVLDKAIELIKSK